MNEDKKIIYVNKTILDLDNKEVPLNGNILTVGRAIALTLISDTNTSDPLRTYLFSRKFVDSEITEVLLDQSDIDFLKQAIKKNSAQFTALVIGQVLQLLA